jgi:beta-phosphoglucomutase
MNTEKMKFAYIFDADGVIINSMEVHFICYQQAMQEVGVLVDKEQYYRQAGMTGVEQIEYFCKKANKPMSPEEYKKIYLRTKVFYKDHINKIPKIDCNVELIRLLKLMNIPVAVASGSSRMSVQPVMERYGIEVDALVTSEDVKKGKPNPDLFLFAAEKLGVLPEQCIVIEDSDAGITAAKAAGMNALRFFTNDPKDF